MMQVEDVIENKKKHTLKFTLKNADVAFANALRRICVEEVPTMAIEDVEIRKNSSVLFDEMVAHRLGLIPLETDLKSYNMTKDCKCNGEGCARCTVKLTLEGKGPGIVLASELKSADPKIKPVYPDMPVAKLLKGQKIELEATATLGQGKDHMKWAPGNIYYINKPTITVNNSSTKLAQFKSKYPPQIFDKTGKIDKDLITENNLIDAVDGVNDDIIKVESDKGSFVFTIESWNQLSPKEIIEAATDIFTKKLEELEKSIEEK